MLFILNVEIPPKAIDASTANGVLGIQAQTPAQGAPAVIAVWLPVVTEITLVAFVSTVNIGLNSSIAM